jgi:YceI-like domain
MYKIIFSLFFLLPFFCRAQDVQVTKTGLISFSSRSKLEDIDAVNNEASGLLNTKTGDMVFAVLMKGFHFKRALMEEHFNENYVESDKYPKSTFKGKIKNISKVDFSKDGNYAVTVDGELVLHNVTRKISVPAVIKVQGGKINGNTKFAVKAKDYDIKIPSLVADKISEDIDIVVNCNYEPKK